MNREKPLKILCSPHIIVTETVLNISCVSDTVLQILEAEHFLPTTVKTKSKATL
jgi:hypothetical protein